MITVGELAAGVWPAQESLKCTANRCSFLSEETKCRSLEIRLMGAKSPVLNRVVEILGSRIQERSGVKPTFDGTADCIVELEVQPGIGKV